MNYRSVLKRIACLLLAVILALGAAACGSKSTTKKKKVIVKKVIPSTSSEEPVDDSSGDDLSFFEPSDDDDDDDDSIISQVIKKRRALASSETAEDESYVPEFTRKTVSWDGPTGYVIVYKAGDSYAALAARYLQVFFQKTDGVTLSIVTDAAAVKAREILVGNTNRYQTSLGETEFAVSLKDKKLIFEGGHRTMVEKAVKWFMSVDRVAGKVVTLKGSDESFRSTLADGYSYVWGEEFDGDFLDKTKFDFCNHMTVNSATNAADFDDERLIRVDQGKLKMSIAHYFSEFNASIEIGLPKGICTGDTMQWLYGYVEMRAKIPLRRGAWPGWWSQNYCLDHPEYFSTMNDIYGVEVDFFEGYGSNVIVPNIHKWYESTGQKVWSYITDSDGNQIKHSGYRDMGLKVNTYVFDNDTLDDYHIFGFRWTPDEMVLSVDGKDYTTFDLNNNFDGMNDMECFRTPLHMIFNSYAYYEGYSDTTPNNVVRISDLPLEFFVDYIRIYQRDGEGYLTNFGLDKPLEY